VPQPKNRKADSSALESIEADSKVTDQDVTAAKKAWRKDAPEKFKNLLDATSTNEDS
jgi:hypothetical protein